MGRNQRAVVVGACHHDRGSLPSERTADRFLHSKERVLVVLMQVLFFNQKDYCDRAVLKPPLAPIGGVDDNACDTPVLSHQQLPLH
jgi:hypothetical protein